MRRRGSILLLGESGPRRRGKPNFSLPPGTNTSDVTHAASGAAVGFHLRYNYKKRRVGIAFCSPVYGHLALASWALPLGIPARSPSSFVGSQTLCCVCCMPSRRVERVDLYLPLRTAPPEGTGLKAERCIALGHQCHTTGRTHRSLRAERIPRAQLSIGTALDVTLRACDRVHLPRISVPTRTTLTMDVPFALPFSTFRVTPSSRPPLSDGPLSDEGRNQRPSHAAP